ncbi:chromosome segregation protein ParM [Dickeya dianthicola]|uniref:chromosome segregation protein ParM n=1 Tax=Dickeya dianthicola TaxID=204039 RepID=UPI001F60C484|nr:chromosome segregation protein ParM [Dickeya dianthicola]MCI4033111.1 chromosome segregation protein ParM [Dickeya dianthicola]MCI4175440.1 chromosome segregation protein ParM [Dickeya dianthicola]MCI4179457.1 chromosome segregation protein ParM [Dickeya dianthicola]MCI4184251.1 chromosome segregation protein ParM [Dickeya dianthicola]MCI4194029.1 chromosome segregation protein ParM [Dickeya dianthicola]
MRLSKNQRNILLLLYGIEHQGIISPVPVTALFNMTKKNKPQTLYANHFRTSCHTLHENGLLNQFRSKSLNLAYTLTDSGREIAQKIYADAVMNTNNADN